MQPLDDDRLKQVLAQWKVPNAPVSLEARLRAAGPGRWWQRFLWSKVEVSVPLGVLTVALLVVLGVFAFRGAPPRASERVSEASHFQLVDDLNPRIIRSSYEND